MLAVFELRFLPGLSYFVRVIRLQVCYKILSSHPLVIAPPASAVLKSTSPQLNFSTMLSLSSSSHSSFDSVFDHQRSRSSSPSSVGSSCHGLADIPPSYRPKTCLYVPKIQPDALKAIFERCAEGGSLGLYLPAGSFQSALHFADWDKQSVPVKGGTQAELFVSSFPEQKMYDSESRDVSLYPNFFSSGAYYLR